MKNRTLNEYKFLIVICIMFEIASIYGQGACIYKEDQKTVQLSLCSCGAVFLTVEVFLLSTILVRPTQYLSFVACIFCIMIELMFSIQLICYFSYADMQEMDEIVQVVVSVTWISAQIVPTVITYRFWEYLLFNYEDSNRDTFSAGNCINSSWRDSSSGGGELRESFLSSNSSNLSLSNDRHAYEQSSTTDDSNEI